MSSRLKTYLFQRKLKHSKPSLSPHPDYIAHISSVNLLFEAEKTEDRAISQKFEQKLEKMGASLNRLGYFDYKLKKNLSFAFPLYDKKDVNWYGIPRADSVEEFCKKSVDITLIANLRNMPHMDFIGHKCDTVLSLGLPSRYSDYQDITVKNGKNLEEFLKASLEILHELQLLPDKIRL